MQPEPDVVISGVRDLLYLMGITANYAGFFHTSYAAWLVVEEPQRLRLVTKTLYPQVALHYGTNWRCVERNIRTAVQIAWDRNRPLLENLARRPLVNRPSASLFLAILTSPFPMGPV